MDVLFLCSRSTFVDFPLLFSCPAYYVPDWQPRILLGMVEARSVNVKKTTKTTYQPGSHRISPPSFCGACLNFYREKDLAVPFPCRP